MILFYFEPRLKDWSSSSFSFMDENNCLQSENLVKELTRSCCWLRPQEIWDEFQQNVLPGDGYCWTSQSSRSLTRLFQISRSLQLCTNSNVIADHPIWIIFFFTSLSENEVSFDQVFIDACKGVVQRCIFLLLGVQTSFPVDSENLNFIENLNKTSSCMPLPRHPSGICGVGPLHMTTDSSDSATSTPTDTPSTVSPRSEVCTIFIPVYLTAFVKTYPRK